jgi:glycosyltransferase involved in cell wall biosynthesis
MKILLIAPCFGAYGGIETFVLRLADEIIEHGHQVTVIFKQVRGFELKESLVQKIGESRAEVQFIPRFTFGLIRLIRSHDLVHTHNPLIEVILTARLLGIPCVSTVYNWCRRNRAIRPLLWRFANHCAMRSWYISEFVWTTWEPRGKRTTSDRLPIISELPTGFTPYEERKGFVFVSRWIENKGLRTLIRAYRNARIDHGKNPLTLMGNGPLRDEVLKDLEENPMPSIMVTDFIPSEERNERIRNARWMVTPPNTKEDLGLTPLEARNVKVPCIVTRDGGILETAGEGALWCEPGDTEGLQSCIEQAAAMSPEEYAEYSEKTQLELSSYVSSLNVYIEEYGKILGL